MEFTDRELAILKFAMKKHMKYLDKYMIKGLIPQVDELIEDSENLLDKISKNTN